MAGLASLVMAALCVVAPFSGEFVEWISTAIYLGIVFIALLALVRASASDDQ